MQCCPESEHAWDCHRVGTKWFPSPLRCLIIGENPGSNKSTYFYDNSQGGQHDSVTVRRNLLRGLYCQKLIDAPTLDAFRDAGFLFDHAIRCHLSPADVRKERSLADRYASPRAKSATHLMPIIQQAPKVWVMGRVARNAVAALDCGLLEDWNEEKTQAKQITKCPYPLMIPQGTPKFFISRYLTHVSLKEVEAICQRFENFFNP